MSDNHELEVKESGGTLKGISVSQGAGARIQTMADAWTLAQIIIRGGMAPRSFDKPEKLMIALAAGAEAGLGMTATLQNTMVINGVPALYGNAPMALCLKSGLVSGQSSGFEGEPFDEEYTAWFEVQRKGVEGSARRTFSVADAKLAGLWGKQGPWKQHPARMLFVRARAFALRDLFSDVLAGLAIAEELEGFGEHEVGSTFDSRAEAFEAHLRAAEHDVEEVEWSQAPPDEPQEAASEPQPDAAQETRKPGKRKAPPPPEGIDPEEVKRLEMAEAGLPFEDNE